MNTKSYMRVKNAFPPFFSTPFFNLIINTAAAVTNTRHDHIWKTIYSCTQILWKDRNRHLSYLHSLHFNHTHITVCLLLMAPQKIRNEKKWCLLLLLLSQFVKIVILIQFRFSSKECFSWRKCFPKRFLLFAQLVGNFLFKYQEFFSPSLSHHQQINSVNIFLFLFLTPTHACTPSTHLFIGPSGKKMIHFFLLNQPAKNRSIDFDRSILFSSCKRKLN